MILSFKQGETDWLSNFAPCKIILDGATYASTEHAYMSAKSDDEEWKTYCQLEKEASEVKKKSKTIKIKKGWELIKVSIMETVLRQKFNQEPYKSKLITTGSQNIQEGNWWNDDFWGVDLKKNPNYGENMLGRLIMNIRQELAENRQVIIKKSVMSSNLFGESVVPEINKTLEDAQAVMNRYNLGIGKHTLEIHRLIDVIICLENELKK